MSTQFVNLVEQVLQEQNTTENALRKSSGTSVLGGLHTNTGQHHPSNLKAAPSHHDNSGTWHDRSPDEDMTQPRRANNKMARHTRGNSLRSRRTGRSSRDSKSRKK
jgi:hypothetical protein